MSFKVIGIGEHLDEIAHRHGVSADEVWNAPGNRALKGRRPGGHMLVAGDVIELPPRRHPEPAAISIGGDTTIVATIPRVKAELVLAGPQGPVVGEPWHIEAHGEQAKGTTGSDGKVIFEVRVTTRQVTLVLEKLGQERQIVIGGLDPADVASGVIHRLNNLWFDAGPPARTLSDKAKNALVEFQNAHRLPPTGEADEATLAALHAAHRS